MSKEETIPSSDEAKQEDKREKERKEKEKFKPRTKIIVRHLPPSMTEEQFISQVSPLPEGSQYYYVRPYASLDEYAFCRAYILIPNLEDQLLFKDKFDNYIFLDSRGGLEYAAIVEYAPYQKFPPIKPVKELTEEEKEKKDSYENDPAYIRFLETKEKTKKTNLLEFPLEMTEGSSSKKNLITTTPLLEFIKERRAEKQRLKEERKKKEIERKKIIAEEKRKKVAESLNFKVIKSEKDGTKNFQNKNKREEDENHKSRYRDEENVKSRFRDDDKPRYRDDEIKLRFKADRREPIKHSTSYEKISSKKPINPEGKKSYEYQNPKYDQKKPHHLREYENKSYHKDFESKSKDYEHKRQFHDDKRRPKSEWKNSKDSKYKDYDSRSKDWEHQGAKPRKKLPHNPTRKEEDPKKILESKNKSENELHDLKQEEEPNKSPIEKFEEIIKIDSIKDLPPVVNSECEIKSNTSSSSKSESDPNTVKSLDSKSNDSDSTLKEEPVSKDPRPTERRIRNKDRPSLEIYRPGMGKFSRQRREQEKTNSIDQESPTNSPNHLSLNKTKGNIHTPSDHSDS